MGVTFPNTSVFKADSNPRIVYPGHKGRLEVRNSPTVYNAAAHIAQFWDGRAADVEAQAKGPILNAKHPPLSR